MPASVMEDTWKLDVFCKSLVNASAVILFSDRIGSFLFCLICCWFLFPKTKPKAKKIKIKKESLLGNLPSGDWRRKVALLDNRAAFSIL